MILEWLQIQQVLTYVAGINYLNCHQGTTYDLHDTNKSNEADLKTKSGFCLPKWFLH